MCLCVFKIAKVETAENNTIRLSVFTPTNHYCNKQTLCKSLKETKLPFFLAQQAW